MTRVFVYGTLKRGGDNHHHLAYQQFLGAARTPPGFTLYSLGDYPGMVRAPADTAGVTGELWAVDDACLRQLDLLEGVNEGLYQRVTLKLAAPSDDQPVETYLYLGRVTDRKAIGSIWEV
jgi:gamma-glutamylaminecyclotransferase